MPRLACAAIREEELHALRIGFLRAATARASSILLKWRMALGASERAVWQTLLPAGVDPALPGLLDTGFEAYRADFAASAPWTLRLALRAALWAATWLAPGL